ncbi:MAG: serine hydrolase [Sphingomonas sp.]
MAFFPSTLRASRTLPASRGPDGEVFSHDRRQLCQLSFRHVIERTVFPCLLALTLPAAAQPAQPTAYQRAIAAGYKALTLCSAIFVAGRTQEQAEALELTGIYPEYDAIVPTLQATVNGLRGRVVVPYDPTMPPRIAKAGPGIGCTVEPIGAVEPPEIGDVHDPTPSPPNTEPDPRPWPLGDAGIAPRPSRALEELAVRAFDGASFGAGSRTVAVAVVRDGRLVAEHYAAGFGPFVPNRTWSVAKSIAGTLVGIAVREGAADVAGPAAIPEWNPRASVDPRAGITLDNLLRMSSGLHGATPGNRTDAVYFGGTAVTEETVAWPLAALPGKRFRYANNDILLALRALRHALGEDRYRWFPKAELFDPIGMTRTVAEQDWLGNYVLSSQVWSTARDLARLGQLWLDDGIWQGRRILPEGWMRYMTTPGGPQPSENGGVGYGATLWLFGPAQGLPEGSYSAQGNRGQYVMVIPSRRLVVVRRGEDRGGAPFDIAKFTAEVLEALE